MGIKNIMGMGKRHTNRNREPPPRDEWPGGLVILGTKDFDDFIDKYPVTLVDFYSPTCGPCIAMSRTIRLVSRQYKYKAAFGKVNIAENRELAKQYKIMSIPYIVIFNYGKKVYTLMGKKSEKELIEALDRVLSKLENR